MLESVTPPLEELGEIRGMSISKTTTAKSCVETKKFVKFGQDIAIPKAFKS